MTDNELRKYFDLKKCPNPSHEFKIGKLMGEWIWAEECWSQLQGGKLQTFFFSFHKIETTDNLKAYSVVIWKLKIIWGFIK